ncbi:hypothetical protein B0J14DRAFT_150237 [Halenospora varia]|nr:hypothetical protein B0J14DRAFT_150237 [Halenospora varia]
MAPTNTRSCSISSASTTSSKSSNDGIKKKFGCTFPNCGKSFSRSEHLHRHALNHKDGNNTCLRCSAHFRRRDLLDRHMTRHKEKDDEAGGEGLGVLATRKRLWRDENGNIVNSRRPSYTQEGAKRRQISRPERKLSKASEQDRKLSNGESILSPFPTPTEPMSRTGSTASSTIVVDTGIPPLAKMEEIHQESWMDMHALPSPPISESESSFHSPDQSPGAELSEFETLYEDTWPAIANDRLLEVNPPVIERESAYPNPSWSPQPFQTFMGAMADLPYDDIFKPETGLYDWQAWNSQVLMSRCREEKFDPFTRQAVEERKNGHERDAGFKRSFGLGIC